jgi:hypothetical protein
MKFKFAVLLLILLFASAPAFAQETTHTLTYDDFSYTYDTSIGANINLTTYAGDDPQAPPGFSDAPYTQFLFYSAPPAPESLMELGGVRVYRISDVMEYEAVTEQIAALNTLLNARVDLEQYMQTTPNANNFVLPFLPVLPAAQVIRARAAYLEGESVRGISFVTVYRQAADPFTQNEFLYTFQGISADGQYYISAVFRLNTDLFPAEVSADFNYDDFIANIQTYFADSIAALNDAAPTDFTPSLDTLDTLFASFAVSE